MRILLIGQCTLHWGRMEYGNIGNYYILEPFVRELHTVFPAAELYTTFQLTESFCKKEKITCLPMSVYYDWQETDLDNAYKELAIATIFSTTGSFVEITPFIDAVLESDLVIDFSGDIWGENADLVGKNRFLVGLLKDRVVQLLKKPIAMLAGSPGPFKEDCSLEFARDVFNGFDLVTNREAISRSVLNTYGFDVSRVIDLACPAFLFEPASDHAVEDIISRIPVFKQNKPVVGFILCGWNMLEGPFNKWPREDSEYDNFVSVINFIITDLNANICFMSHSNGFELPPSFKMIHGRDYPIVSMLKDLVEDRGYGDNISLVNDICSPAETKAIIRKFDMLVSGRVHAAVAGLSQAVPTVIIDYGHEPKAHKLKGFARVAGIEDYVADPASVDSMICKVKKCWVERENVRKYLEEKMISVKATARKNFELLKSIM